MIIEGKKTILRAIELNDMEMYREMANDPQMEWLIGGWSFPISTNMQMEWFESIKDNKTNLRFTIVDKETGKAIGMENLMNIDWKNRSAFTGIKLHKNTPKNKGFASDAVMALMQYCFEELQLNRLDGAWNEYNEASLHLYQKCGWTIEGRKKRSTFKHGKYYDRLFGGILVEDYYEAKERLKW